MAAALTGTTQSRLRESRRHRCLASFLLTGPAPHRCSPMRSSTQGATIRLYFETYESGPAVADLDPTTALAPCVRAALAVTQIARFTGRDAPTVVT